MDLIYIGIIAVFFGLTWLLVRRRKKLSSMFSRDEEAKMEIFYWIGGIVALGLLIYLV